MKRLLIACALLLVSVLPVQGQTGTTMPIPLAQWFDNNGAVLGDGGLCVFVAGTSTLATTYTTAALAVANANPIEFDSAGRPSTGGVFLVPGRSYKFLLKDFTGVTSPTCVPDTGVTVWSVDNVQAVPGSASAVDVTTATAGESISAGDAVFLSNGSNSLNAGQWYKTDSDLTYKSTKAAMVGVAPLAIGSGSTGSVRISGAVTVTGPLSPGLSYFSSGTPGAITSTPPTNAIRLGVADSATSFVVGYTAAPVGPRGPPCGRLTLTTGTPVTSADVTAATTLYYTPAGSCNQVALYDGTVWADYAFAEISITNAGLAASKPYDVWAYDNAGVVTLELLVWTNDTTRATALAVQNGVYVKTGALTRRYLGTIYTDAASKFNDAFTLRHVWNYYNRQPRAMRKIETTDTWVYDSATYQQANASAANQLDLVIGVAEVPVDVEVYAHASHNAPVVGVSVSIGEDGITPVSGVTGMRAVLGDVGAVYTASAKLRKFPAVGRHIYTWIESGGGATTSWYGDNGAPTLFQAGISGWIGG